MMRKIPAIASAVIFVMSFVHSGCSPKYGRSVLSFFFDGVPPKDSLTEPGIRTDNNINTDVFRINPIVSEGKSVVHYPYKEKDCFACHNEQSKSELVVKQPDLCYMCHDDFQKLFKYVHGPASSGYCTVCHDPHMSDEKGLMNRKGQHICTFCHDLKSVVKSETHKEIADTECTLCHNPHGGDDRFILN